MTLNLLFQMETHQEWLNLMLVIILLIQPKMKDPIIRPKMEKPDMAQIQAMQVDKARTPVGI